MVNYTYIMYKLSKIKMRTKVLYFDSFLKEHTYHCQACGKNRLFQQLFDNGHVTWLNFSGR